MGSFFSIITIFLTIIKFADYGIRSIRKLKYKKNPTSKYILTMSGIYLFELFFKWLIVTKPDNIFEYQTYLSLSLTFGTAILSLTELAIDYDKYVNNVQDSIKKFVNSMMITLPYFNIGLNVIILSPIV
jgi:hypothetical protein